MVPSEVVNMSITNFDLKNGELSDDKYNRRLLLLGSVGRQTQESLRCNLMTMYRKTTTCFGRNI